MLCIHLGQVLYAKMWLLASVSIRRRFCLGGRTMRFIAIRIGAVIVGVCLTSSTIAEIRIDEVVRLSKLTLSAMQCAILATDTADSARLSEIGLVAGKKFLELAPKLSDEEAKIAGNHIAILWRGVLPGPSSDFILGRVWQEEEEEVYRSLGNDTEKWEQEKVRKFSEKNCMIIR